MAYEISFDNRYMITGFVSASLMPGTPFINMWGNVTVNSLLTTNKKGEISRINRRLQSANQDNIAIDYDTSTLNSILALIRICRFPNIIPYTAFLDGANDIYPCVITNLETNQLTSQPIDIDIDHTIFTTQYANWNSHQLSYFGNNIPANGSVWSGGLVLGSSGTMMTLGEYLTKDVLFNIDQYKPTYIEKLTVSIDVPGYQYLRAQGYDTPFIRADQPYILEWFNDSSAVVATELYCLDFCCSNCDGDYYGTFAASGFVEVDGHPRGTQRLWLVKGISSSGVVISQMWFSAVATCPRRLTYFDEFIEDCKASPAPQPSPPVPTPSALPPEPSPSPSTSLLSPSVASTSPSPPSPSLSPSQSRYSISPSPSLPSPSPSGSLPSSGLSPSLLSPSLLSPSPSPSQSRYSISPSPSPSRYSPSPSLSPSPELVGQNDRFIRVSDTVNGKYAVTWVRYDMPPDDIIEYNYNPRVMARLYDEDGTPLTDEFLVASDIYSTTSLAPDVAMTTDGRFVIAWAGPNIDNLDSDGAINARMYYADGSPINVQYRVNNLAGNSFYFTPAIAMRPDNGFTIVFVKFDADDYAKNSVIMGRRFSTTSWTTGIGVKLNVEFQISEADGYGSTAPDVGAADNGNLAVTWTIDQFDGSGYGIYAQRYNGSGIAQGANFQVNTYTANWQTHPDVALDRSGNFVIVWDTFGQDDPITADYGIWYRTYNAAGTALGQGCVNNPGLTGRGILDQVRPAVSRNNGSGKSVCVWQGYQGIAPGGGVFGHWQGFIAANPPPSVIFTITSPVSGSYAAGSNITIRWSAYGVQPATYISGVLKPWTVCLSWSNQPNLTGTEHWVSVGVIEAVNGSSSWVWNTSIASTNPLPATTIGAGNWYIVAYIWDPVNKVAHYGFTTTTFKIV